VSAASSAVLAPLVDTLFPAVPSDAGGPAYPAASVAGVDRDLAGLIAGLPDGPRSEFASLLRAIESPLTNWLLSGHAVRFSALDAPARERFLRGWAQSRLAVKRRGFQAAKRLAAALYFSRPIDGSGHPLWTRIHYVPPPLPADVPDPLAGVVPVQPDRDVEVAADVCVIGSGAGGGVIADRLAAAGWRVVVLESGPWFPRAEYPRTEGEAFDRLFVGRGVVPTRDSAIAILAGEAVGGSTTINWMTCLPPRPAARAEWVRDGGLVGADGPEFDRTLAEVAERVHVSSAESDVNPSNDALRRGCRALGYREGPDWGVIPRNAVGCRSRCGFCTFGCPYQARQSALLAFLGPAARSGARIYASTRAEQIEVEGGRVRGVTARFTGGERPWAVHVRANTVVLAAGALSTPALLLRSGVRFPGVGAGLRLDPTTALAGEFPQPVRTWEGPPQTIGVYKFQGSDPGDHGPWIEVAPAHPGLSAIAVPWAGAADFRRLMERTEYVATPIVLVRDVGEGRVTVDAHGRPVYDYRLTRRDRSNLVRGMVETARILRAAGATRLLSLQTPYVEVGDGRREVSESELDAFVAGVERAGVREHAIALFSAHPMGSARAGTDPKRAAAWPTGEVHGVEGLWVGDGSLLPSAPGANPMLSILALAAGTADRIVQRLSSAG
jgi:choline dehydrogenase-like flavoprotein